MKVNLHKDAVVSAADAEARARFWSRVEKTDTCWLYPKNKTDGYGTFRFAGKNYVAHRVAKIWAEEVTSTPFFALHLCNIKNCVRPAHIYFGTIKQNVRDAINAGVFPASRGGDCKWASMDEDRAKEILTQYMNTDASASQLATQYNISVHAIHALVGGRNWRHINKNHSVRLTQEQSWEKRAHGEESPMSKLNKKDIADICELLLSGAPLRKIARNFRVSLPVISRIAYGTGWKKELHRLGYTNPIRVEKKRALRIGEISEEVKRKAFELRLQGHSYTSISKILAVSKRMAEALANKKDKLSW